MDEWEDSSVWGIFWGLENVWLTRWRREYFWKFGHLQASSERKNLPLLFASKPET